MSHTKGPWRIPVANVFMVVAPDAPNHNRQEGRVPRYPEAIVCTTNLDNPSAHEDARLISAAPDLLEALEFVQAELKKAWDDRTLPAVAVSGEAFQRMDAAIAKAKGQQ